MSALPLTKPENISNLLTLDQEYSAPAIVADNVLQKNWSAECKRSLNDPEGFWADYAQRFEWLQPWSKVLEWDGVHHQWFTGAKTNITINALDRHANSDRCNRAAFIWLGEDGSERIVTYGQLYRQVCRFANGLKSLGVVKGDRTVIYMPLTIEGALAMLACARIGAIHSVVYAGLGHTALRDRITDAQAKIVIAGDVGFRRGKTIALKAIVGEALESLDSSRKSSSTRAPKPKSPPRAKLISTTCSSSRRIAPRKRWTPNIRFSCSTPQVPRASPRASCMSMADTWSAPPTTSKVSSTSASAMFSGANPTSDGSSAIILSMRRSVPASPRCSAKALSTSPVQAPPEKSSSVTASPKCSSRPPRCECLCVTVKATPQRTT